MNKLEVGMFCRIKTLSGIGRIAKLEKIDDICITDNGAVDKNNIIKARHNILDLIEVGDYVNGYKITLIHETYNALYAEDEQGYLIKSFGKDDIKSIVTKEQFSSMKYRLGDK